MSKEELLVKGFILATMRLRLWGHWGNVPTQASVSRFVRDHYHGGWK